MKTTLKVINDVNNNGNYGVDLLFLNGKLKYYRTKLVLTDTDSSKPKPLKSMCRYKYRMLNLMDKAKEIKSLKYIDSFCSSNLSLYAMSYNQEHDKVYGTSSSYFDAYDDDDDYYDMLDMNEKYKRYKLIRKVGQQ